MSMHKIPLSKLEKEGLQKHNLPIGAPSQLSDTFRLGMKWAQTTAEPSYVAKGDNTSYMQRLVHAFAVLCGGNIPPESMIKAHFTTDSFELQEWCVEHMTFEWAMGITIIDAACKLASEPDESGNHLDNEF